MQKTSRFSRLMAVLLAVFMAVCCLPLSAFAESKMTVGVNYWDAVNNEQVCEGEVTVAAGAYNVNTSALTDVPDGYQIKNQGDVNINGGWIYVEVEPVTPTTKEIGVNYWDVVNNKQAGEGKVTVAADAYNVNTSALTDVPAGYQIKNQGDAQISDGWIYVEVEPVAPTTKEIGVNYWDVVNNKQAGEGKVTVAADAYNVNTSVLTDVPAGYEIVYTGDTAINDNWIYVEVRPVQAPTTKEVGVNYWDIENNKQAGEGKVTVAADAYNVNTSVLTDVPAGYEIAYTGDVAINDNWIYVEVRPVKAPTDVIMNIVFKTADGTVAGGGDYFLPEGVQKLSILDKYVPAGYKICETGDFMVTDGGSREVRVEKISNTVIMNIVFKTAEGYVAGGGDYFLPEGVQNYKILNQYVPEGYRLCVTGDFMVTDGGHETVRVEKIPDDVIVKTAVFRKGADDVWNENEDNPDEVRYSFFSDDPEATNTVPSITTGDKTKVLDYWVSERDDSVTLKPGAEFCFNDLKKGDLGNEAGDFAFYPVYKDAPKTPADGGNTSSGSSNNNSSNSNTTTVTATNDNGETVVKAAAAPANNSAKILPQTGVAEQTPVAFGVMMFAALAGAAAYLFAIRKKLN